MGSIGFLFCFLCFTPLFYFSQFVFLLFKLFLIFFFLFIFSNFSLTIPNIPYWTSCYFIHIVVLLYIFPAILLLYSFWYYPSSPVLLFCCVLLQISLLIPIHSLSFFLASMYLFLPYILFAIPNTCSFL